MDDKCVASGLLAEVKNCLDLYEHAALEASTANIRQTFAGAFNETLSMADNLYQQMSAKGWYQNDDAPQQKLAELRQKFTPTC